MRDYSFCGNRIKRQQATEKSSFRKQNPNTQTHLSSEHAIRCRCFAFSIDNRKVVYYNAYEINMINLVQISVKIICAT